jgi:hypothetical protein
MERAEFDRANLFAFLLSPMLENFPAPKPQRAHNPRDYQHNGGPRQKPPTVPSVEPLYRHIASARVASQMYILD